MNNNILNIENQIFIENNINTDINKLLLKGSKLNAVTTNEIVEQIEAKKRCKTKLKTWYNTKGVYYPNKLNIEQTSSEATAAYKSSLISGKTIIDLTGGFGVDTYYFSKKFDEVYHCEINENLSQIVSHNYSKLKVDNIKTINANGIEYLKTTSNFDWIYVDPSRRHDAKGKVFYLKDCLPNVPENLELLFKHTNNILIKTSPMLDISVAIEELSNVKCIYIVALKNEVKELLFELQKDFKSDILLKTININQNGNQYFNYKLKDESTSSINYDNVSNYIYEPNTAILKSGAFKNVAQQLNISKLHKHSHLYTSKELIEFPGRSFKVIKTLDYNKKIFKTELLNLKANITTRNFPQTVNTLKKKHKIKDGGELYLFFTTNKDNEKIVVFTHKA
ncbi:THUMP-like domain-containing protein [Pontimicrobium sp. IMCC45349]|uniref:THUMP-like domain-containing protein n=1 Tax=Pontimicrobium sp. IMCC45349 TaxID=3391574 RepID=UPI0039A3A54F